MDVPFHVINEYEILKKVLLNLNSQELIVASKVNQYWKSVAYKVLEKKAEVTCIENQGNKWSFDNCQVLPKLVVFSTDGKVRNLLCKNNIKRDFLSEIKQVIDEVVPADHEYSLIFINSWKFIYSLKLDNKIAIHHSKCLPRGGKSNLSQESLLMLPQKKNLKIDVNVLSMATSQEDLKYLGNKIIDVKCCIILSADRCYGVLDTIGSLCGKMENSGKKIPMAGGISRFLGEKKGKLVEGVIIMFEGEDLSAHSFLLPETCNINNSFSQMSKKLGPVESGYERISFIFTCVDRYHKYKENETKEFAKHFPNVPLNGFWSQGEFGLGFTQLDECKIPSKRRKLEEAYSNSNEEGSEYMFTQSSIYLFITYKKE